MMFARTDRLLLRPWWPEDAATLRDLIGDAEVARTLAQVPHPYELNDAEAFCAAPHDPALPRLAVIRRTKGAPQLIGGVGLSRGDAGGDTDVELGYWIARPLWGLGYATEAAEQVARIGDAIGHARIAAYHHRTNTASARVLAKLGFKAVRPVRRHSLAQARHVESMLAMREAGAVGNPEPAMDSARYREMIAA